MKLNASDKKKKKVYSVEQLYFKNYERKEFNVMIKDPVYTVKDIHLNLFPVVAQVTTWVL